MQQMREAFPWDQAPRYVLRDRDAIYGSDFAAMSRNMGMEEVLTAPRSPWQNPFAERLVGSIRRECLDHVIVWNERSLQRPPRGYDLNHPFIDDIRRKDFTLGLRLSDKEVVKS